MLQFASADDYGEPTGASSEEPLVSPSLYVPKEKAAPAYELKFLLTEELARAVEQWAYTGMTRDPHAGPSGTYRTTSLYCDTPQYDIFHRTGPGRRRKHRLRQYAGGTEVFLERKTKRGQQVRKRRSVIPETQLPLLEHPLSLVNWSGHWFHRQLLTRQLRPVCRITYERTAFMSATADGTLRLTLDRTLRGQLSPRWRLEQVVDGAILFPGEVICEFKYRNALPPLFKQIIGELKLTPSSVSKYRHYLRSTGMSERKEA